MQYSAKIRRSGQSSGFRQQVRMRGNFRILGRIPQDPLTGLALERYFLLFQRTSNHSVSLFMAMVAQTPEIRWTDARTRNNAATQKPN